MKSAYELAMERLEKSSPSLSLTEDQKKEIAEGTEEWELLHKRYYAEELKKLGIDLASR